MNLLLLVNKNFILFYFYYNFFIEIESNFLVGLELFFIMFTIIFASLVSIFLNPTYSLLSLLLTFTFAIIYLAFFELKYFALVYILLYVGAIIIVFLCIIMILVVQLPRYNLAYWSSLVGNFYWTLIFEYFMDDFLVAFYNYDILFERQITFDLNFNNFLYKSTFFAYDSLVFNNLLYTNFSALYIILGFILLVALISSITITRRYFFC